MEDTHNGVAGGGLPVANHAGEEFGNAFVHARILQRQTVEATAADWEMLGKHGAVTLINVQVKNKNRKKKNEISRRRATVFALAVNNWLTLDVPNCLWKISFS